MIVRLGKSGGFCWIVVLCACAREAEPTRNNADAATAAVPEPMPAVALLDAGSSRATAPEPQPRATLLGRAPDAGLSYALEQRWRFDFGATGLAIGDVTGDGRADLVVADGALRLLTQGADGALSSAVTLLPSRADTTTLLDVNADGLLDIVVAADGGVSTLLARGGGRFDPRLDATGPRVQGTLYAADIDQNGQPDLVALATDPDSEVVVYFGDGAGHFEPERLALDHAAGPASALALGDLTGDGAADLVLFRSELAALDVFARDAAGEFSAAPLRQPIGNTSSTRVFVSVADLNDDGRNDILLGAAEGLPGIAVIGQTLDHGLERRGAVATGTGVGPFAIVDADRDGQSDVITVFPNEAMVRVYAHAPGNYRELTHVKLSGSASVQALLAVGDLDSDGCPDLVVAKASSASVLYGVHCR